MRLYFNVNSRALTASLYERTHISQEQLVARGDTEDVEIIFHQDGTLLDLDPNGDGETLKFGVKVSGDEDGSYVFYSAVWTKRNGTRFEDGALNSTTTLGSATAQFNAQDVGLPIFGNRIPAGTTIAGVTSSTEIELSQAATATGTEISITISGRTTVYSCTPSFDTKKGNNLLGYDPDGFAEVTEIRCLAGNEVGSGFKLFDAAGSVGVWIDLDNAGGAVPSQASDCDRVLAITSIASGDTGEEKATKIATALSVDGAWVATSSGIVVSVEDTGIGSRTPAADFEDAQASGFGISRWIAGSAPQTMGNVESVTLDAEVECVALGRRRSSQTFSLELQFDLNQGGETGPIRSFSAQRGRSAIGNGVDYLDIVFPSAFAEAPALPGAPAVEKASAGDDNIFVVSIANLTATGFRAYFNAATPNGNYHLHWLAFPA